MPERQGLMTIGEKDGHIITAFVPPLEEDMLFEAMSGALSMHEVMHPKNSQKVSGIVYKVGNPDLLEDNLAKLREEVGEGTGYEVKPGVKKLGAAATK